MRERVLRYAVVLFLVKLMFLLVGSLLIADGLSRIGINIPFYVILEIVIGIMIMMIEVNVEVMDEEKVIE